MDGGMSTVDHPIDPRLKPEEEVEVDFDSAHEADHPRDVLYIKVAAALFVLTGMEVYTSYAGWMGSLFLPVLLILMAVKFVLVVLFFMHLKFDAAIFGRLFWSGFFLAVLVYVAALSTFHFFLS
jgi:cytochrome c oxidase subunit 4